MVLKSIPRVNAWDARLFEKSVKIIQSRPWSWIKQKYTETLPCFKCKYMFMYR